MINMAESRSAILPLPKEVVEQLSSSTIINSLEDVVLGLVENSLDANSSKIKVHVDFHLGSCTVEDDGEGISGDEFSETGGLGKRFRMNVVVVLKTRLICNLDTSKFQAGHPTYGEHGKFLSSIAALSILSISSRQRGATSWSRLIFHHSRPAARFLQQSSEDLTPDIPHGTQVIVKNLFGNMPVRVKLRARSPLRGAKDDGRSFERLKSRLVALLISFHSSVVVFLSHTGDSIASCQLGSASRKGSASATSMPSKSFLHSAEPARHLDISLICKLLTQAGYLEPRDWDNWVKTSARAPHVRITGAFSLRAAPTRETQFISLGTKPLFPGSSNVLFDEVNKAFSLSLFATQDDPYELEVWRKDTAHKQNRFTRRQLKAGTKGSDRWPMFLICIDLLDGNSHRDLEREDILHQVLKVLRAMINGFLETHKLQPRSAQESKRATKPVVSSRGPMEKTGVDPFASWSRIKSSHGVRPSLASHIKQNEQSNPNSDHNTSDLNVHFNQETPREKPLFNEAGEEIIEWMNPITKARTYINGRTGLVVPKPCSPSQHEDHPPVERPTTAPGRLTRRISRGFVAPQEGTWANEMLSSWENPIFALPAEKPISKLSPQTLLDADLTSAGREMHALNNIADGPFSNALSLSKISKQDLRNVRVIDQVDKKFILVSMCQPSNLLLLVDQHAADERVRFEELLAELKDHRGETLKRPLVFELAQREARLFTNTESFFQAWGIKYDINQVVGNSQTFRLTIRNLPTPIAERCRTEPKLLIELLRGEAWRRASESSQGTQPPQGFVDLLGSRACRSAIMFNDVLSKQEARVLIQRLAACDLPFQCAHGRPSVIPLVGMGSASESEVHASFEPLAGGMGGEPEEKPAFGKAWARWRRSQDE